jgi:type V secretory pathway adhesin AidA
MPKTHRDGKVTDASVGVSGRQTPAARDAAEKVKLRTEQVRKGESTR